MMNSWLGINRFGLVFTKHLFGQAAFHPVISRVLTVILLWITAMVLSFFVHKWSGGQKRFRLFSRRFDIRIGQGINPSLNIHFPFFQAQSVHVQILSLDEQHPQFRLEQNLRHIKRQHIHNTGNAPFPRFTSRTLCDFAVLL